MTTATPTILVTGATGNIGTALTQTLSAQDIPFTAMVRSLNDPRAIAIASLKGATLVPGDFDKPESLRTALTGAEKAFLLTNSTEQAEAQQCAFVEAAQAAGVQHIVKLSQWAADAHSPVRYLRYHAAVENAVVQSGIAYTFLRPNLFMQGLFSFREFILNSGQFFASLGNAAISMIDTRDIADAAAAVLTSDAHKGKIYNLTGPQAITHYEAAALLSAATGHEIRFVDVPPATMKESLLKAGFPEWQADGLIEDYAHYARGEASAVTTGVRDATGNAPRDFAHFAKEYASQFTSVTQR